jgi:hypothetical protein
MKHAKIVFCQSLISLLLCACGGGGGGGGSSDTPPVASQAVINSANAGTVAGRSADAAFQSGGFGGVLGSAGLIASSPGASAKPAAAEMVTTLAPIGPETTPCLVSGSTTINGDIANPVTITAGDFINIDVDNCDDGEGVILDGLLSMTFTSFEGDLLTGMMLLGFSLDVDNFQALSGNEFNLVDGDISLSVDTRTPMLAIATTSGSIFTVSSNTSTETLRNFSSEVTENSGMLPSYVTTDASGTVESTEFDGAVSYTTPVVFESLGEAYPYAGELLIRGANNATLRLIALDEANVRIEADYDGDGAIDETTDTTWDALFG